MKILIVFLTFLVPFVSCQSPHCDNSLSDPPWHCNQKYHKVKQIRDASTLLKLCQLTNLTVIKTLLRPIVNTIRVPDSPGIRKVAKHIKNVVSGYGFHVEEDQFYAGTPHGSKAFTNIIATKNPNAPRRLVMACHYDSKYESRFKFYGATDSAVPCALLLDLAATLSLQYLNCPASGPCPTNPLNGEVSLQLLFFDGEEAFQYWTDKDSLYGSRHLAHLWDVSTYPTTFANGNVVYKKQLDRMDVMVLLDLLGHRDTPMCNFQTYLNAYHYATGVYEELPTIELNLRRLGCLRNTNQIFYPDMCNGGIQDDHLPFMQRNVKIVHLIPPRFTPVWHKKTDDAAHLDSDTIENLASILRVFVAQYLKLNITARHNGHNMEEL